MDLADSALPLGGFFGEKILPWILWTVHIRLVNFLLGRSCYGSCGQRTSAWWMFGGKILPSIFADGVF